MPNPTPSESTLKAGYRGWRFTNHAIERMDEMGLKPDEIVEAILEPELSYPSIKYPEMHCSVRGRLAVSHHPDGFIATILWHGKEGR